MVTARLLPATPREEADSFAVTVIPR